MWKYRIISLLSTLFALSVAAQNTIRVEAPDVVGLEERFNVAFVVEGEHAPGEFNWSPSDDFQLVWGPQKGTSSSISIVNGKTSRSSQTTFTYILLPKKAGTFTLPSASAKVKGETIGSKPFTIQVVGGSSSSSSKGGAASSSSSSSSSKSSTEVSSDDVFMRLSLSRTSVVVGEPVTATLKLYQRANIVGFENAKFPSFNGFWSQEVEAPSNIEFRRETLGDEIYNVALIRRYVLIPQKTGKLTIDPFELVCLVNVRSARRTTGSIFDSFFDDEYVTVRKRVATSSATVNVSALPAGAPSSFSGGVGTFSVSAKFSKDSLKAHDAASLIVTISGKGNVSLIEAPKITFPPDFETYDVKVSQNTDKSGTSGSKTFEYPFIPRSSGEFSIDPVRFSYYDVNAHRYSTSSTDTLRLRVSRGSASASPSQPQEGNVLTVDRKGVKNLGEDIRFIRTKTPDFSNESSFLVGKPLYWVLIIVMALAAAALWLLERKAAARRADVRGTKNRGAAKMALKRLKLAGNFLSENLQTAFYEELHKALLGFISDKLSMDMADQTKENISAALLDRGISEDLSKEFTDLLDECEYARYAPSSGHEAMNTHYTRAVEVITAIDSSMKKPSSAAAGGAALIAALLMLLPKPSEAAPMSYPDSLWNVGVEAYSAARWDAAAEAWQSLLDAGIRNADLLYNTGNAYLKTGETGRAVLCYERALRLDPSSADVRYNLEYARNMTRDRIDEVPEFILKTWMRKLSYLLPSNTWAVLSLLLFAAMLAMLLLFLLGGSPGARKTGFFTGIVLLLLSLCCFGFSRSQKAESERCDEAIVMKAVSSVKSTPSSESAKDLFILHEGTKVKILDTVGSWYNISLSDGRQGWISLSDIEII